MLSVFITDLAAYNAGSLVGRWVQLPITGFELSQAISVVLTEGEHAVGGEKHEEIFITDFVWNDIVLCDIDEYKNIFELNNNLKQLSDLDRDTLKILKFLLDEGITHDIEDAISRADDVIIHHNYDMEDVAYDLVHNCYGTDSIPKIIANNIDYDGIGRDLEYEGTYWEIDGDVYEYYG